MDAVRCAVEIQRGMTDRERDVPDERRIAFRIGINLGDVIVEEHDIFGDGVNVAARLEALGRTGRHLRLADVHDQVRDKLTSRSRIMGEQSVKNIARPVRVYALRPEAIAGLPASAARRPARRSRRPLAAPRLSIVVLPFANLSDDPEQQYFADGITEDLTTDLSRIAGMFVISRNTAFTYRNKPVDTKQIGRELGVRYVLEGSVRRSGNQVRINAQLIDAETDAHLWAERFDRDTADLFGLQDEITSRIAIALNRELVAAPKLPARPSILTRSIIFCAAAPHLTTKASTRENLAEAIGCSRGRWRSTRPSAAGEGLAWRSRSPARVLDQMTDTPAADLERAEQLIARSWRHRRAHPLAHFAKGQILRAQNRFEEAIPEYEMAIALNRNWVTAIASLGQCKFSSARSRRRSRRRSRQSA